MRINKCVTIVLTSLASTLLCVHLVEGAGRVPDLRHVRWILKVAADRAVLPPDFGVVASLLRSDGVAGAAMRDVLSAESGRSHGFIEIQPLYNPLTSGHDYVPVTSSDGQVAQGPTLVEGPAMLLSLEVNLPDDVKPVARELGTAIVDNFQHELEKAFSAHVEVLRDELKRARVEQDAARVALSNTTKEATPGGALEIRLDPADEAVHKQLDTLVDLSALQPERPFAEAIDLIRRSVEPPLQITVLWRELLDNAQIEPSTPINMDGLTNVKLGTGLRNLLDAMSNPQLDIQLDYVVAGGAITIGTDLSLPQGRMETQVHEVPTSLRAAGRMDGLEGLIQQTIEPDSWFDLSEKGKGTILPCGDTKLIVQQTPEVHRRIAELLRSMAARFPITMPVDAPREVLEQQTQFLLAYRKTLKQEIDKLQDRQGTLAREKNDAEKQAMENSLRMTSSGLFQIITDLEAVRSHISGGAQGSPDARALTRTIDWIKQCADMCSRSMPRTEGGYDDGSTDMAWPPWGFGSNESQTLSKRLAAKQGELEQVSRRIARIQDALIGQTRFDPEVHRLHVAAKRLEEASVRVHRMERQIAELQPCTVTILGDSD
jgi:hypothetical protein